MELGDDDVDVDELANHEDNNFRYGHARRMPRTMNAGDDEEAEDSAIVAPARHRGDEVDEVVDDDDDDDEEERNKRRLFRLVGLYPRDEPPAPCRRLHLDDTDEGVVEDNGDEEDDRDDDDDDDEDVDDDDDDDDDDDEGTRSRGSARVPRMGDLFISDSEDEETREAMRRRPAVFLRKACALSSSPSSSRRPSWGCP